MTNDYSAEQRLLDAVALWSGPASLDAQKIIDAATRALVDGLDSPALRELAGAWPLEATDAVRRLLDAALAELDMPQPGDLEPWQRVVSGGRILSRPAKETIRFEIAPTGDGNAGHQVLVFVDEVEMTSRGAGLGMSPHDLFDHHHRLRASDTPSRVPIARCSCGEYGCGSTDVTILRDGDAVHWDWSIEVPMQGGVTFRGEQYDTELARISSDHSWESPADTTTRLILDGADHEDLAAKGLRITWASIDHHDEDRFMVSLFTTDERYQVMLRVERRHRPPVDVATDMLALLAEPPPLWHATFHSTYPPNGARPPMAGPNWERFTIL